jgi:cation transport ATPase
MEKKIIVLIGFVLVSLISLSQNKCPFGGKINCEGECGNFIDNNGDGFCDNGKVVKANSATQNNNSTSSSKDKEKNALNSKNKSKEKMEKTKTLENKSKQNSNEVLSTENQESNTQENINESQESSTTIIPANNNIRPKKPYLLLLISILTLALYAFTAILVKMKKMKKVTHRKIWNVILLITCLVSCLLGFFLAVVKNYDINIMRYYLPILKLHVDFGISMTLIAVIHIIWHLKYFKNLVKRA